MSGHIVNQLLNPGVSGVLAQGLAAPRQCPVIITLFAVIFGDGIVEMHGRQFAGKAKDPPKPQD